MTARTVTARLAAAIGTAGVLWLNTAATAQAASPPTDAASSLTPCDAAAYAQDYSCNRRAEPGIAVLAGLAALSTVGTVAFHAQRGRRLVPSTATPAPPPPTAPPVIAAVTDAALPGPLPLVLRRACAPGDPVGGLFGPAWASTLDARIEVHAHSVRYVAPDGRTTVYPHPPGQPTGPVPPPPVLPLGGNTPAWALAWDDHGGFRIEDQPGGLTLHFAPSAQPTLHLLSAVTDRDGNRITVRRSPHLPTALEHSDGRSLAIDTAVTPFGPRVLGLRLVADAADRDGPGLLLRRYVYDSRGCLVGAFDTDGAPAPL